MGDEVFEPVEDKQVQAAQARPELALLEDEQPEQRVHMDLEGLGDLYETKR